jgi:lipopolysaccharide export system protein LptC
MSASRQCAFAALTTFPASFTIARGVPCGNSFGCIPKNNHKGHYGFSGMAQPLMSTATDKYALGAAGQPEARPFSRGSRFARPAPQTRSESEFASAYRHSQRVRLLKLGLPLFALFGIGFFSAATIFAGNGAPVAAEKPAEMSDGRIIMANPKLEGFTGDKRPYKMVAERAIQQSAASTAVELEKITADLPFGKGATAKVTAASGVFDNSSNSLDLSSSILLTTSDGMTANLQTAKVNIATSEMSTDQPVDIKTAGSHITADSMKITNGGKVVIFENRVRLNIDSKQLKQAKAADSAASGG